MESLDVLGKKFGKLTVVEPIYVEVKNKKKLRWKCICDCGNEKVTTASRLVVSTTISCGCMKGKSKTWTVEKFVEKARDVHGDKFDYSKTVYVKSQEKLTISCKSCGKDLIMTGNDHLSGTGCGDCRRKENANKLRLGTDDFVRKCMEVHGNKFDYSAVVYTSSKDYVKIRCNKCTTYFEQVASAHLGGKGCKQCAVNAMADRCRDSVEDFIRKAKETHGDKYEYHLVEYKNALTDVDVVCKKHGKFSIRPNHHTSGSGCEKCGKDKMSALFMKSQDDYLFDAKKVHGEKYDYSKVEYRGAKYKVTVGCSVHGNFDINAQSFLTGIGCASCANWGFDFNSPATLYVLNAGSITKVGITGRDVQKRLSEINSDSGKNFNLVRSYEFLTGRDCYNVETLTIEYLAEQYNSPTDKFDGYTECFYHVSATDLYNKIEQTIKELNG